MSTGGTQYEARAASSGTFGRVLCSARQHHFVVDGPVHNGAPGEALLPPEIFLAGVASCAVELIESFARGEQIPLERVGVTMTGTIDRSRPVRPDLTLFNAAELDIQLHGVTGEQATHLIDRFKKT
jgi:uncharacterized OsmC-like protein